METITFAVLGVLVSLIASLLTKLFATKMITNKQKIKIGGVEIQLSESADESIRRILDRVQELQEYPQVYISYSFQDEKFVQLLAADLQMHGVQVWLAEEQLKVGDRILDKIRDGISSSQYTIVLLSENLLQSKFFSKELELALDEEKKRDRPFVLPAMISKIKLPIPLQDKQYADFTESYSLGLEKILARVKPSSTKVNIQNQATKDEITEALHSLKKNLKTLPDEVNRRNIQTIIDELEIEVKKSDKVDEQTLNRLFQSLTRLNPDITEGVLTPFLNPIKSISFVIRRIAVLAKEEGQNNK